MKATRIDYTQARHPVTAEQISADIALAVCRDGRDVQEIRLTETQVDHLTDQRPRGRKGYLWGESGDAECRTIFGVPLSIEAEAIVTADEFHRWSAEQVRRYSARIAAARERECRRLAEQKLRPRLRWLVDHPRLLGWVYRLLPSWRPTLRIYQGTTAAR